MPVEHDDNGNVIFLAARAPGQVAAQRVSGAVAYRGATSGNANFDPASGRFAKKGEREIKGSALVNENPVPVTRSGIPQGVSQEEWERRLDMVRQAARELATVDPAAATKFLKKRVTDLSRVDIAQFMVDVRANQIDDLLDAFDAHMRSAKVGGVKLSATASWVKRMFRTMTDVELASFATRLQGRGFSAKQVAKSVASRVKDESIKESLANQLKVKLEDEEEASVEFDDWEPEPVEPDRGPEIAVFPMEQAMALVDAIREMPAPVVHVAPAEVKVELPPPRQKRIVRDPVTNEIIGVDPVHVHEPDAS